MSHWVVELVTFQLLIIIQVLCLSVNQVMVKESLCPGIDKVFIFSANHLSSIPGQRKGASVMSYRRLIDETNSISIYSIWNLKLLSYTSVGPQYHLVFDFKERSGGVISSIFFPKKKSKGRGKVKELLQFIDQWLTESSDQQLRSMEIYVEISRHYWDVRP